MILMTGGAFQGKLECAREILAAGKDTNCEPVVIDGRTQDSLTDSNCDIISHVTDYMRIRMASGSEAETVEEEIMKMIEKNPSILLITTEVGCGLVPVDASDRRFREAHGRMCCRLAQKADRVYRVSCGLSQCIKGE